MSAPSAGLKIVLNGRAIELLHKISENSAGQLWRVRLLFVRPEEIDVLIRPCDVCTPLHNPKR